MGDLVYDAGIVEQVVVRGDLSKLTPSERARYYAAVCRSLGVNPLTRPFDYIVLSGRLTLYARRDCTDQLRRIHGISIEIASRERLDDLYIVTARATDKTGRRDEATGIVSVAGLQGDALANALMKAETKAKRRVTLSIVGLGWLDESEVESIPGAEKPSSAMLDEDMAVIEAEEAKTAQHWIDDEKTRRRFWQYVKNLGLSQEEVYLALGVEKIHDFAGSASECKDILDRFAEKKKALPQDKEAPGVEEISLL